MAYVRRRGRQLAIVRGERHPETKKVEQQVLFAISSRDEAREISGRGDPARALKFQRLFRERYPGVEIEWRRIQRAIAADLDHLPETYEYKAERLVGRFRGDLEAFVRQLVLADPQSIHSAAVVVREHRHELAWLRDLIDFRLRTCDGQENEWNKDDRFFWRFALRGSEVPGEAQEQAAELYETGELDGAEAVFKLLIQCFGEYAEGWNYLGLIALERGDLALARERFEKTVALGRRDFPRRFAKKRYGKELSTRPYLRGLRNLALTLNRLGEPSRALAICDHLEGECGDALSASAHRVPVYLKLGRWEEARAEAGRLRHLWPDESLLVGLAEHELGRPREAVASFLHGALNAPRLARALADERCPVPRDQDEADADEHARSVILGLGDYLSTKGARSALKRLRAVLHHPKTVALLAELERADAALHEHKTGEERRPLMKRRSELRSLEFAESAELDLEPSLR